VYVATAALRERNSCQIRLLAMRGAARGYA
jgi:hypothetical protein